jgi:hypothetical protein
LAGEEERRITTIRATRTSTTATTHRGHVDLSKQASTTQVKGIAMASSQQAIQLRVLVAGTGLTFKLSLHPSELT